MNAKEQLRDDVLFWHYENSKANVSIYRACSIEKFCIRDEDSQIKALAGSNARTLALELRLKADNAPTNKLLQSQACQSEIERDRIESEAFDAKCKDVASAQSYLVAKGFLIQQDPSQEDTLCEAAITVEGIDYIEKQRLARLASATSTTNSVVDMFKTCGSLALIIGVAWLALYYALIVHFLPDDFDVQHFIIIISVSGVIGMTLLTTIAVSIVAPSFSWIDQSFDKTPPRISILGKPLNDRLLIMLAIYSILAVLGLIVFLILKNSVLVLFGLIAISGLIVIINRRCTFLKAVAASFKKGSWLLAPAVFSPMLWLVGSWLLSWEIIFLTNNNLNFLAVLITTLIVMPFITVIAASTRSMLSSIGIGFVVVFVLTLVVPDLGRNILAAPWRFLSTGSIYMHVTALTYRAGNALKTCVNNAEPAPKPPERKFKQFLPYSLFRHYRAFVLSDIGNSYVFQCERLRSNPDNRLNETRRLILPKSEVVTPTVLYPPDPMPTPFTTKS